MKITFPHMGNLHICAKALLEHLDLEVILPPPSSNKTITLGTQNSPEFACLPLKVNMGNFMEAYEKGADTIIMAGGCGPCRFGYYAQVQREILKDLGYDYQFVVLEPPEKHVTEIVNRVRMVTGKKSWLQVYRALQFAWYKAKGVDEVEKVLHKVRPRELQKGLAEKVYKTALMDIDSAKNREEIKKAIEKSRFSYAEIPIDTNKDCLRIGLVGEIFVVLEPFVNLNIEKHLGEMGVEVERSIYLSEWINEHLFLGLLKNVKDSRKAKEAAKPYINHFVGGHGQETVGNTVLFSREGFDGVVQVSPFTCMPEIVAESVIPKVNKDLDIPTYSIVVDEHSGEAGVVTRLEAFVDLLERRRYVREANA